MKSQGLASLVSWRRLGRIEVWNWQFLFFSLMFTAALSFAFDAVRLNNYSPAWIPVNLLSFALACAFVYLALTVFKRYADPKETHPIFNVLVAGTAIGIKNVATLNLANVFGIYDQGSLLYRFFGGASIGIALIFIFNNLVGSQLERQIYLDELMAKERALLGFRESVNELYVEEEKELTERTRDALLPRFIEIQDQVESGADFEKLTGKLQNFLAKEIRPLSKSIAEEAAQLNQSGSAYSKAIIPEPKIEIELKKTILPIETWSLTAFAWFMTQPIVIPTLGYFELGIASLIYLAFLYVIKAMLHSVKPVSMNVALLFSGIPPIIAALPAYWLLYQVPHTPKEANLLPTFYVTAGWAAISVTHAYLLSQSKVAIVNRLQFVVERFSRENKIFEQKLWVARHVWYTLLHGSVQSAITAATIRASSSDSKSKKTKSLILADLNRAMDALKNTNPEKVLLEERLEDLKNTWEGIAVINFDLPKKISKAISSSRESVIVFNELLKEIISNAVRHGQATTLDISFTENEQGEIEIVAINNGTKPKASSSASIGTSIFNALCLSTKLSWNRETKRAEFTALVPIA
jgi:signal transduction histidine kinase